MREKIGVFGGTFNPVHNGHLNMAEGFFRHLGLDRVLMIPVWSPPHKSAAELIDAPLRLEMCRLAARARPWLEISDLEIRRQGKSYTVDTLRELSAAYPQASFYLLMGADMFRTMEQWRGFREIIRDATLCCAARHEGELCGMKRFAQELGEKYHALCRVENIPVLELSSTEIRERLAAGGDVNGCVPPEVLSFIRENGLYRKTWPDSGGR